MGALERRRLGRVVRPLSAAFAAVLFASRPVPSARAAEPSPPTAGFPAPPSEPDQEGSAAPRPETEPGDPALTPRLSAEPSPASVPTETPAEDRAAAPAPLPPAPRFPVEEPPPRNVSLTVSPLRLLTPMFEAGIEVRVGAFGVMLFGGAGRLTIDGGELDGERLAIFELGGIVNAYPLERFESLSLGAELLWLTVNADDLGVDEVDGVVSGVAVGPLLGYKTIGATGFTFSVQGGVAYVILRGEAENAYDERAEQEDETLVPLVNLNLGWSF